MSIALVDYGCHSFSFRLASILRRKGIPISYLANGSLESPNLSSLTTWMLNEPDMVRIISCDKPYGKIGLRKRLKGELEWGRRCTEALDQIRPTAIVANCVPLTAVTPIHRWAVSQNIPFIYWLQDIQSRAIHDLLGRKLGMPGRTLGAFAHLWEQDLLEQSNMVITIAPGHEAELPSSVRRAGRYELLENWANIEEFAPFPIENDWSQRHGLNRTINIVYSGTLGLKHDLNTFYALAERFKDRPAIRIVIVSSDQAAENVRAKAEAFDLSNMVIIPFQPYADVPKVLASASVLIAPLEVSAGAFCVPSKILSYLCAGRPIVIAINESNAAAKTIHKAGAGCVVPPGNPEAFIAAVGALVNDEKLRTSLGMAARSYAELTFGIDKIAARFLGIVERATLTTFLADKAQSAVAS